MKFKRIIKGNEELIEEVIKFFFSSVINKEENQKIIEACLENPMCSHNPNHDTALKIGALSINDFLYYSNKDKNISIKTTVVEMVLDKFCESFLFSKDTLLQSFGDTTYKINKELALFFYKKGLLHNLLFSFSYIAEKYRQNVFKIIISNSQGDQNIGTGFSFKYMNNEGEVKALIITNKHVTSHGKNIQVLNYKDEQIEHIKITTSKDFDLSVIEVSPDCCENTFHFYHEIEILDEVITMGYPPVATTVESYQLVHKGEVNAFVRDYWGSKYILFSAKTSPGNSGGPLVNSMGMVSGIVTKSLEHERENQLPTESYYAAITSQDIINFINADHL